MLCSTCVSIFGQTSFPSFGGKTLHGTTYEPVCFTATMCSAVTSSLVTPPPPHGCCVVRWNSCSYDCFTHFGAFLMTSHEDTPLWLLASYCFERRRLCPIQICLLFRGWNAVKGVFSIPEVQHLIPTIWDNPVQNRWDIRPKTKYFADMPPSPPKTMLLERRKTVSVYFHHFCTK